MWTKILIFMVVFFLVANPATFKIVRGLLGGWVASAEGLATPAGLVLHAAVFVGLAIFLPKALMRASGYEDDDGEEYESDDDGEEFEDEDGEGFLRKTRCAKGQYYSRAEKQCMTKPMCPPDQYFSPWRQTCRPRKMYRRSRKTSNVIVAPGAAPPAAAPAATVAATPVVTVPVATTSPYVDYEEEYIMGYGSY